ncbi:MAG: hypothetical protein WD669_08595 [Pirellulales bacterium]
MTQEIHFEIVNTRLVSPFLDRKAARLEIDRDRPSVVTTNFSDSEIKLAEAEFFLDLIEENSSHQALIFFGLSAFLSAARAVTLFVQAEGKDAPGFAEWYESVREGLKTDEVCRFLKDQRNTSSHERYSHIKTVFDLPLYKDGSRWIFKPDDGIFVGFSFIDYIMDNGLTKCHEFLERLRSVVLEAKAKGFLPEESPRRVSLEFRDIGKPRTFGSSIANRDRTKNDAAEKN